VKVVVVGASGATGRFVVEQLHRNAIVDSGVTSRINVGDFITELILNESTWSKWKGHMPVIYNHA
jgi:hypothetical protein